MSTDRPSGRHVQRWIAAHLIDSCEGFAIALLRGLAVPESGRFKILIDTTSGSIEIAELELGFRQALLRRRAAPVESVANMGRGTLALKQHDREVILREAISLLG